jgi:hypothetical protein
MATKRKTTISDATAKSLSALDWAVKNIVPAGRLEGEFTSKEYHAKISEHQSLSMDAARSLLTRAIDEGKLVKRTGREAGRALTFYSLAENVKPL